MRKKRMQVTMREEHINNAKKKAISVSSYIESSIDYRENFEYKIEKIIKMLKDNLPLLGIKNKGKI